MDGRRWPHPVVAAAVCVVLLLVGALLVRHYAVQAFRVPSASMAPALQPGDVLLADRTTRGTAEPGEIVVFDGRGYFAPSAADGDRYWVKRVIAVGGQAVHCCDADGAITVDGTELEEHYLPEGTAPSRIEFDLVVPDGRNRDCRRNGLLSNRDNRWASNFCGAVVPGTRATRGYGN